MTEAESENTGAQRTHWRKDQPKAADMDWGFREADLVDSSEIGEHRDNTKRTSTTRSFALPGYEMLYTDPSPGL